MWYINSVFVLNSALKHGIAPEDSIHAIRCAIVVLDLQEGPHKTLYLGLDRSPRSANENQIRDID